MRSPRHYRCYAMMLLVLGLVSSISSWAADTTKLDQARAQAQSAAMQGESGHAKKLVEHAERALNHVKAANISPANPDLDQAIKALASAIEQGKAGATDTATVHVHEAIQYLDAVRAGLGG